ncbi:MAG: hypothetical protein U0840_09100 [Gemmataceae bacterium]
MSAWTYAGLIVVIVANVLLNAGITWLACRWLHPIDLRRALRLTLAIFLIGWPVFLALAGIAWAGWQVPLRTMALWVLPPLGILIPYAVFRVGLKQAWGRTLAIFLAWRIPTLGQSALLNWLLGPWLAG